MPALFLAAQGCDADVQLEDGEDCCLAEPTCPDSAAEVEVCATEACFSVEACCSEILCEPGQCTAAPSCEGYETQVPSCDSAVECRPVTLCGVTIYCLAEVFCGEVPSCDPGDEEVPVCPDDASCYEATACGATITCFDSTSPAHGCPETVPFEGEPCGDEALICDYPINDCFESWSCQFEGKGPVWTFIGGGCKEG